MSLKSEIQWGNDVLLARLVVALTTALMAGAASAEEAALQLATSAQTRLSAIFEVLVIFALAAAGLWLGLAAIRLVYREVRKFFSPEGYWAASMEEIQDELNDPDNYDLPEDD